MSEFRAVTDGVGPTMREALSAIQTAQTQGGYGMADARALLRRAVGRSSGGPTSRYRCDVCSDLGLVSVDHPDGGTCAARCLCAAGQRQRRGPAVDTLVDAATLAAWWPSGRPAACDPVLSRLTPAGLPARAQSWTATTFDTHFAGRPAALRYASWVPLWAAKPAMERPDLVLVGAHGTGKTGLAVLAARACLARGEAVRWWYVPDLLSAWRAAMRDDGAGERTVMQALIDVGVLILDEFGGATITDFVQQGLTTVLHSRQQAMRPTILTLNAPLLVGRVDPQAFTQIMGPALADRLAEHAEMWPLDGPSQRPTYRRRS